MKRKPLIPIVAVVMFVLACVYVISARKRVHPTQPPLAPPEQSSLATVAAVGLIEPQSENIDLSCPVSGMVTQLFVHAGDQIQAGQALFSVDDRDVRADLRTREAALAASKANLAKLEQEPRPEELPPAQARVDAANAEVADTEVQVRLIESVTDRRAVRQEDIERRRAAYAGAKARLAEAQKNLSLLQAGTWAPDLAIARATVAQNAAVVNQSRVNLDRLTMRAPVDGVLLQNHVRLGQYAQCADRNVPLMVFGGGHELHLRADVSESDAWRLQPGVHANASVRGNSALRYPISFVRFEPYVVPKKSLTGDSTERVDTRVLQIIFRFDQPAQSLFIGQQMDVYIESTSQPFQVAEPAAQKVSLQ